MPEISFGSTFKIPVSQWGINNTKKLQFKSLIGSYSGSFFGKGNDSFVLLSIPDSKDITFVKKLQKIGYFDYLQIKGEKIPKNKLEAYVNDAINKIKKGKTL